MWPWTSLCFKFLLALSQSMPRYYMYYSRPHLAMPSLLLVSNDTHLSSIKTLLLAHKAFNSLPHCHWYPTLLAWHFSLSGLEASCSLLEICYSSHAEAKRVKIKSINTWGSNIKYRYNCIHHLSHFPLKSGLKVNDQLVTYATRFSAVRLKNHVWSHHRALKAKVQCDFRSAYSPDHTNDSDW